MARSCVFFNCTLCGNQKLCLDRELLQDEVLTCRKGHIFLPTKEGREKINLAFKSFVGNEIEVYL